MARMPVVFVGHGSPMNALENNRFTKKWVELSAKIPKPEAILSVSAHWYTRGARLSDVTSPEMVYDMYGFPDELYRVVYPAPGSPALAAQVGQLLSGGVRTDNTWGLDHGTWSVLKWMYPKADIPVMQLSVNRDATTEELYDMGRKLQLLRDRSVLIMGSGNVVHNLALVDWNMEGGTSWADDFDRYIREAVLAKNDDGVIHYRLAGASAERAFYTMDHFAPLLITLGAANDRTHTEVLNDERVMGALSMTGYMFN